MPALRAHPGALSVPLLSFDHVSIGFGLHPLLEDASFTIEPGERVCLIGRNGAGKSTLLRIVAGELVPDGGEVWRAPALRVARLSQELDLPETATVFDAVAGGLPKAGALLAEYHRVAHDVASDPALVERLGDLQHALEAEDAWRLHERVEQVLARLALPGDDAIGSLSGGWRRRVALARALVSDPDLLLLDEPTNHLDVEVIEWLEETLAELRGGVLFVTHDRAFLTRLATRILELDRGVLTSWAGDYATFLEKKAAALAEEERHARSSTRSSRRRRRGSARASRRAARATRAACARSRSCAPSTARGAR